MKKSFDYVLNNYKVLDNVDSSQETYKAIVNEIPEFLRNFLNDDKYYIKGSVGKGRMCVYPFVAIMDKNITMTTQKGLYIVYLFKCDMSGFYLSLNQGITNFNNLYKKDKYKNALKVADYFRKEIDDNYFSKDPIDLGKSDKSNLGKGYECTNIISKYYSKNNFDDNLLKKDLEKLITIYQNIIDHMNTTSYNEIIEDVLALELPSLIDGTEASQLIKKFVDPNDSIPYGYYKSIKEVKPTIERTFKFKRLTNPHMKKIDYIQKNYRDQITGVLGEGLVIEYEKERLINLGREDLADKIKWVSQFDDSRGYDIESFNIDKNGKPQKLRIEVKTSTLSVDTEFFVSANELSQSIKYKDSYCVYRIYNSKVEHPYFYKAFGAIEDNFILDPISYRAIYKYK